MGLLKLEEVELLGKECNGWVINTELGCWTKEGLYGKLEARLMVSLVGEQVMSLLIRKMPDDTCKIYLFDVTVSGHDKDPLHVKIEDWLKITEEDLEDQITSGN